MSLRRRCLGYLPSRWPEHEAQEKSRLVLRFGEEVQAATAQTLQGFDLELVETYRAAAEYGHRMTRVYGVALKPWMLPLKVAIVRACRNRQMRGYYLRVRKPKAK